MTSSPLAVVGRVFAPLALLGVAALFASCGVATEDTALTAAPPTATATVEPSPTPDDRLLSDGGVALIQRAYERLLDQYIEPLDPSRILDGAWTLLAVRAEEEGIALPLKPEFADDRVADFELFKLAYIQTAAKSDDPTQLRYASIRGMTQALQDCHTFFLSPVASDTLTDQRGGKGTIGIGVDLAGVPPRITEIITAGPAERAGLKLGDTVVEIDGEDTSSLGPASAFERINGEEGTDLSLGVQRAGEAAIIGVTVKRERVTPPNIEGRIIDGKIGYVRVRNFVDTGIAAELRRTLDGFETSGATSWIIDMRGNPGGRLDTEAMSLFIKEGVIVRDQNRAGELSEDVASGNTLAVVRPTVLLTNNRTGSVAEVFAAALDEYDAAYIVGENTNGCVGYTDVQDLGDGSSLAVTTNVNLGPVTSAPLNGIGVAPDELVGRTADDIAAISDPQLDAAIAHLAATAAGTTP
jgi:carboxyl-terminal processing protease